jgi:hypothetical protein
MDRVSGSYKRWVIVIAIVIVGAGNIDSIAIARSLYAGGAVRTAVTQQASESFCNTPEDPTKCAQDATELLEKTGIPLGWSNPNLETGWLGLSLKGLGLLISVGAAALGAFWYRLLDQIGTLRNTGRPPEPGS